LAASKAIFNKNNYLYVSIRPILEKFYIDYNNDIKKSHTIGKRVEFLDSNFGRYENTNFQICIGEAGLNLIGHQNILTSGTL
jgi:hypothetical protein